MDRMKDKVVLVFGAGSVGPGWGNGKAAAVAYAREGGKVVCTRLTVKQPWPLAGLWPNAS